MDNKKNDTYYIEKVIENIEAILKYTKDLEFEDFINDPIIIDATMFRLIQMVENITHISKEYRDFHSNIKWGQIIGFRNGIVHDYGKTDYSIVYEIISSDLFKLRSDLLEDIENKKSTLLL